ncbi:LRR-containing protein [Plasmopara halstedii]|uniref:LRR-containing protein n=1 Tax=Plasmopara halstedii TaxID=4781 RepID=A0A0N7L3P0_PLAHL|nr:LRR-containing protein [Plasmopara halstedii]CEG36411.1 LRR-containing protein [Plasmopara halstedii]|eukprot:XP_024572780.1 LRR-containing protein [Plasmopara halstedii]
MAWGTNAGVDDLLQKLANPKTSKSLYVMRSRAISDSDMVQLATSISKNTVLEELYISGHHLGPQGLQAFVNCLSVNSTLKHLSLGSENLKDQAVQALSAGLARNAHSSIQSWDLEFKSLGVDGAAAIANLLETNQSLAIVALSRNQIGDQGVEKLAKGLRKNAQSGVKELLLTDVGMSGAGLDHLAMLLECEKCSLLTLQLSFNALENASCTFFDALAKNTSLTKLQLKECSLSDVHVAALATALQQNSTLIEIDLSDNNLTQVACASLAQGLSENKTLKIVRLNNNKCQDEGAVLLANVLASHNSTLKYVDLGNNGLTSTGMTPLLKAQSLTQLHLFNNKLGKGLNELLPILLANSVIETLGIGANELHMALSVTIFDALHSHPSLQTLEMGGNTLGKEGLEALDKLRKANHRLDVAVDKNAQNEDGSF